MSCNKLLLIFLTIRINNVSTILDAITNEVFEEPHEYLTQTDQIHIIILIQFSVKLREKKSRSIVPPS